MILPLIGASLLTPAIASGAPLDVNDFCDVKISAPASVKEMRPLADGVSYTAISEDGRSIEVYSYKTGNRTGVLFSLDNQKGDVKISEFDGYELSANEKKILLWNDTKQIYRHSFTAEYFVYDIMRGTLARVSTAGAQRCAVMSHDGRMVAYTRDNNIFISNLDYGTDYAVTKDGKINEVINGAPDWGYEEEFGVVNTIRWSPDDNILAFVRFDESSVPMYSFDDYKGYCDDSPLSDPYPASYTYKYPLAGYPVSIVSVHAYDLNTRVIKTMDLKLDPTDYVPSLEFAPSGALMAMVVNHDQNDLRLYSVNPGSTVARQIYTDHSSAWLSPGAYQMVEYGKQSFVIGSERSGYRHLYEYDYNGSLKRQLTKGDFNVTSYYGWDARNNTHYVQTTSLGAINRNVAAVTTSGLKLLHSIEGTESASFSSTFDYYVRSYSNATVPPQYTVWTSKGKKIADVEMNAAYAAKYKDAPIREYITVKNDDGK